MPIASVINSNSYPCSQSHTSQTTPTLDLGNATVAYQSAAALGTAPEETFTWTPILDVTPGYSETVTAGSVRFRQGGSFYFDRNGSIYKDVDPATGAGTLAGTINYASGEITLTAYSPGTQNASVIDGLLTTAGGLGVSDLTFRTASAPIRSASLTLQFQFYDTPGVVTVTSDSSGNIIDSYVDGKVDYSTGIVRIRFGEWVTAAGNESEPWYFADAVVNGNILKPRAVLADSLVYACVAYSYIPLDADILGINPVRLPSDGRVPIFRTGDVAVVHHDDTVAVPTPSNGLNIDCGRTRLSRVWLFDEGDADTRVATAKYTADLDAGIVTLVDVSGLIGPLRVEHRIEDMALVSDVQINGQLTFTRALTHDYPATETGVSSALVIGDLQARVTGVFDQQTWTGEWSDELIGSATTAEYNDTLYPIAVSNLGATQDRWMIKFISPTTVDVIGESTGQIASGLSIANTIAPLNPATGAAYFTIDPLGWGSGWSTGNVLRFNTVAANYPIWLARTVKQGPAAGSSDSFRIQIRGDADA